MKQKPILVSFIALFAIILVLSTVSAFADIDDVIVNDISVHPLVGGNTAAGEVSNTVPVEVKFTANLAGLVDEDNKSLTSLSDVRVKVYIEGYREEISDSTSRFRIVNGSSYIKRFSLELPSSMDLDNDPEDLVLYVRISAKGEESIEEDFDISMQRDLYTLGLLSIEAPDTVTAGSVIAIDVVLKNTGYDRLDDTYVRVSIPGVVERNVYFGDIASDIDVDYDQVRDTINKRIYLSIPSNAVSGIYNLEVEAYNYDLDVMAKKQIVLSGIEADEDEDDDEDVEVIDGDETETSNTVLILTVILAIIFVVLLIILIVLLTKKPSEIEEFGEGETSYY